MPRNPFIAALSVLALLANGCTLVRPAGSQAGAPDAPRLVQEGMQVAPPISSKEAVEVVWLLEYFHRLNGQPEPYLESELEQAVLAWEAHKTAKNQLRLALLFNIPETKLYNPKKSLELLQGILSPDHNNAPNAPMRDFAYMLHTAIMGQQQEKERAKRLEQQLKELQLANEKWEQQLDALKAIEKSMSEREKGEAPQKK